MKVKEEKLLAGGGNKLSLADKVLERCMIGNTLPLKDMILTDKFFLLLNLRSISYGPDYTFTITCGCSFEFKKTITLPDGLQLKVATDKDKEPFDIVLPRCKKTVSLKFLRGSDEAEIESYIKGLPSGVQIEGDPSYEFRLSRFIAKIDGKEVDMLEKLHFCENLIGADSLAIRRAIAENETGPIMTIKAQCPQCRNELTTYLPLTNEFFPAGNAQ
jgi:hypothetical protein